MSSLAGVESQFICSDKQLDFSCTRIVKASAIKSSINWIRMARELLFDPFVDMKDFHQHGEIFDPHKLPLMSSVWPSVTIACVYLLILRLGPRWEHSTIDCVLMTAPFYLQIDEKSPGFPAANLPRNLQHLSSACVSLFPRQRFPYRLSVELFVDLPHARLQQPQPREAAVLQLSHERRRANRNDMLRPAEEVQADVVPPHLSPRIDLHFHIFRRDNSGKWVA